MEACGGCVSEAALWLAGNRSAGVFVTGSLNLPAETWQRKDFEVEKREEGGGADWKGNTGGDFCSVIPKVKGQYGCLTHSWATIEPYQRFFLMIKRKKEHNEKQSWSQRVQSKTHITIMIFSLSRSHTHSYLCIPWLWEMLDCLFSCSAHKKKNSCLFLWHFLFPSGTVSLPTRPAR